MLTGPNWEETMSIESTKEDGVRREEVQGPLTETWRHETDQNLNDTSSEMASFCTQKKCASVVWQWFRWWSGVALPCQGINVMRTNYELNISKILPVNGDKYLHAEYVQCKGLKWASPPSLKFFRRPDLNTRPKFEQCSCSLANLNWVLGLFPIDLVEGQRISNTQ